MTKIIKINVFVSTCFVGSDVRDEIDVYVDDEMTPEEIETAKEDAAREWMFENINWGWEQVKN